MLSNKSEQFVDKVRIELMKRNKEEYEIRTIEDNLREHLYEAENDGKSLDEALGTTPKEYIDSLHKELPIAKNYRLKAFMLGLGLLGILMIPSLISGVFEYTLSHLLYTLLIVIVVPMLLIKALEHVFLNHIDYEEDSITNKGITILFGTLLGTIVIMIVLIFLARSFPIIEFFTLAPEVNRTIGIVLLTIFLILSVVFKAWPLLFVMIVVAGPEIFAQYFVGNNPAEESYILVTMGGIFILSILGIIIMTILINKNKNHEE